MSFIFDIFNTIFDFGDDDEDEDLTPPTRPGAPPKIAPAVESYGLIASRGGKALDVGGLSGDFADRLAKAILEAEAATGTRASVRDAYRDPQRQAQYRADYTQQPVVWNGVTFTPQRAGGLAAPPGKSRHQHGEAADLDEGEALRWLHKNADKYGLEFLKGNAFNKDRGHIQMQRTPRQYPTDVSAQARTGMLILPDQEPEPPALLRPDLTQEPNLTQEPKEWQQLFTPEGDMYWAPADGAPPERPGPGINTPPITPVPQQPMPVMPERPKQTDVLLAPPVSPFQKLEQILPDMFKQQAAAAQKVVEGTATPTEVLETAGAVGGNVIPGIGGLAAGAVSALAPLMPQVAEAAPIVDTPSMELGGIAQPVNPATDIPGTVVTPKAKQWPFQSGRPATVHDPASIQFIPAKPARGKREAIPAQVSIDTAGGPVVMKQNEIDQYGPLGVIAVATLGMLFLPRVFQHFRAGRVPDLRPVRDAAPNTMAATTVADYARMADDVNAPALNVAQRIGVPTPTMDEIGSRFHTTTRAAAGAIGRSAAFNGRAETPDLHFHVPVSINQLAQQFDQLPHVQQYMRLWDQTNDIRQAEALAGPNAGPVRVRGLTMQGALSQIHALEQAHGRQVFDAARQEYRRNLRALRDAESRGEYGTLSRDKRNLANSQFADTVPTPNEGSRVAGPLAQGGTTIRRVESTRNFDPDTVPEPTSVFGALGGHMEQRIRFYLENNAKGRLIDAVRRVDPRIFQPITRRQRLDNPEWKKNTVSFFRRGREEFYTTDPVLAGTLNMDPYYFQHSLVTGIYKLKRGLELGTTGPLAPWFSFFNLYRGWGTAKLTSENLRKPGLIGTHLAIGRQLAPQIANTIAQVLNNGQVGRLAAAMNIPQSAVAGLASRLTRAYEDSMFVRMQISGGFKGSMAEMHVQTQAAQTALNRAISTAQPRARALLEGWRALLSSISDAPQYEFVRINTPRGQHPSVETLARARNLTGDPQITGQYRTSAGVPIPFESNRTTQQIMAGVARSWGLFSEAGRASLPWFNAAQQSIKRIGKAWNDDPTRFTMRMWLYSGLPAGASYLMAHALDKDPNGLSYRDYMMNRRSNYQKTMYLYIPIPGRPAEQGIEFPRFHEGAPFGRMTEVAMDHMFGSNLFNFKEDAMDTLANVLNVVLTPPMPPEVSLAFAVQGQRPPQGIVGGEAYTPREDPFDQNGGMNRSLELTLRTLFGGVVDILGGSAAAFVHSDKKLPKSAHPADLFDAGSTNLGAVKNAATEGGRRFMEKVPVWGPLLGFQKPVSSMTPVSEAFYEKRKAIGKLMDFYNAWTSEGSEKKPRVPGMLDATPRSAIGGKIREQVLGETLPAERAGLDQPKPTNPLYEQFAKTAYARFRRDNPADGGIGFLTIMRSHKLATDHVNSMRHIDDGNVSTWQQRMEGPDKKEQLAFLQKYGIDWKKPREVRNFYEKIRHDTARVLLFTIRGVENEMSKDLGRPVKIEDLDPYGGGNPAGNMMTFENPLPY